MVLPNDLPEWFYVDVNPEEVAVLKNMIHYAHEVDLILQKHGFWSWLEKCIDLFYRSGWRPVNVLIVGCNGMSHHFRDWTNGHFGDRSLLNMLVYSKIAIQLHNLNVAYHRVGERERDYYATAFDTTLASEKPGTESADQKICHLLGIEPRPEIAIGKTLDLPVDTLLLANDLPLAFYRALVSRNAKQRTLGALYLWCAPELREYVHMPEGTSLSKWFHPDLVQEFKQILSSAQEERTPFNFLAQDLVHLFSAHHKTLRGITELQNFAEISGGMAQFLARSRDGGISAAPTSKLTSAPVSVPTHGGTPLQAFFQETKLPNIRYHREQLAGADYNKRDTPAFQTRAYAPDYRTWHPFSPKKTDMKLREQVDLSEVLRL